MATGLNPTIPASYASRETEYRAHYLNEWEKDELTHFLKLAVWSWFVPLCILMASILICIVEANYLPTSLDGSLISGICVTTVFIGVGASVGAGILIGLQGNQPDPDIRAIRVAARVIVAMQEDLK